MRIAYVITTLTWGGAEIQTVDIATRMARRSHQVLVISLTKPTALTDRLGAAGATFADLGMAKGRPDLRGLVRLARLLREFRPDVVHTHLTHGNLIGRLGRLLVNIPRLISTIHSTRDRHRWTDTAYRLTDWLADLTTGVSQAVVDRYLGIRALNPSKARVVYNGIDTDRFATTLKKRGAVKRAGPFVWCAAGRLTEAKDYPGLLAAMAWLRDHGYGPDRIMLAIAGEGELRAELELQRAALGLDNVRFAGLQSNLPDFFAQADAFVLSSAWEGFGLVVAEALAAGLPVVSTDCGGTREILDAGRLGSLVPVGDPAALAKAMIELLANPPSQAERESRADWVGAHFAIDAIIRQWENLYGEAPPS